MRKSISQNRVAVITGAGSGIGQQLAVQLAAKGYDLALSDISESGLAATKELLQEFGVDVQGHILDVADGEKVQQYASVVEEHFGNVNLVINNAGVAVDGRVEDLGYEHMHWLMNINFWGVVHGTKAFLPLLKKAEDGYLVNISSVFGLIGVPGQSIYNASKFAVRGFTESLRQEMLLEGSPVRVSCVHPGGVKTAIARNARAIGQGGELIEQHNLGEMFARVAGTTAAGAAAQIIQGIENNNPRILVGKDARMIDWMQRFLPRKYQQLVAKSTSRATKRKKH